MELFKKAHKSFIINWLLNKGIISAEDSDNLKAMLGKSLKAYSSITDKEEKKQLTHVIYVLYHNLGSLDWRYRIRYLADKNLIPFQVKFIFTFRLLFSSKKRRSRIDIA
jgi:hypothetical protein